MDIKFQKNSWKFSALSFGSSIRVPAFSKCQWSNGKQTTVFKRHAQLNEVAVEKSSNSLTVSKVASPKEDDKKSAEKAIPDAAAISAFMEQVFDLVKLVDSRDITELQLKQMDCEIVIRKKEALPLPPQSASPMVMPQYMSQAMFQTPALALAAAPAPATPALRAPAPSTPPTAKASSSSHPPLNAPWPEHSIGVLRRVNHHL